MYVMIENIKLLYSKSYYSVEIRVNCLKLLTNCNSVNVESAMSERTQWELKKNITPIISEAKINFNVGKKRLMYVGFELILQEERAQV